MKKVFDSKKGFTLIELIIVIVILGILGAIAMPKFANFSKDAKEASVEGMAGAVKAGAAIVHGKWLLDNTSADNVTVEGKIVHLANISSTHTGYPSESNATNDGGINIAVDYGNKYTFTSGIDATPTTDYASFKLEDNCEVRYDFDTTTKIPAVTTVKTGCN